MKQLLLICAVVALVGGCASTPKVVPNSPEAEAQTTPKPSPAPDPVSPTDENWGSLLRQLEDVRRPAPPVVYTPQAAKKEFEETKAKAEKGDPIAQYSLGTKYHHGWGSRGVPTFPPVLSPGSPNIEVPKSEVPQNFKEAAKWYRKAAVQGHAEAQYSLGNLCNKYPKSQFSLTGTPSETDLLFDDKESMKWYRKAAVQGHARAQIEIANLYANGHGVPVDYVTAYVWYLFGIANDMEITPDQIAKAQQLSREMIKKNPELLK